VEFVSWMKGLSRGSDFLGGEGRSRLVKFFHCGTCERILCEVEGV